MAVDNSPEGMRIPSVSPYTAWLIANNCDHGHCPNHCEPGIPELIGNS